ncbi:MAG: hypothetical protein ACKVS6_09680 [Planctomycetota bacterium]
MLKTSLIVGIAGFAAILTFQNGTLSVGDKIPENKFTEVVWGWDGAEGLQDYRGEPVLIDFWGKN